MNKKENEFIGMSKEELETQKSIYECHIKNAENEIAEAKESIKAKQHTKKVCEAVLQRIEEAMLCVGDIQYENVVYITKSTKDLYVGSQPKSYYCASDWREVTIYKMEVIRCNKKDNRKGRNTVGASKEYKFNEKTSMFMRDLIYVIEDNEITKVYLGDGVLINKAVLKKHCPNVQVLEQKWVK